MIIQNTERQEEVTHDSVTDLLRACGSTKLQTFMRIQTVGLNINVERNPRKKIYL